MSNGAILIVDDQPSMRRTVSKALDSAGYSCVTAESVKEARGVLGRQRFDLIVCDLRMPGENGLALIEEVQAGPLEIPILMMTAVDSPEIAHKAALLGANGYLVKPFSVNELRINVDQAMESGRRQAATVGFEMDQEKRIEEVRAAIKDLERGARATDREAAALLAPLSEAVGRRDLETGAHIRRIGESSALLAESNGMSPEQVESLRLAAPMHDVGKVAIPDSVLLKPGRLDPGERLMMERHAEIGHDILSGSNSPLLDLAAEIAMTHHEKYDGTGYPLGLVGDDIPLSGRIVAVADVFDALTSDRPYRNAMPPDRAEAIMTEGRGTHFDPGLLDLFMARLDDVKAIRTVFADALGDASAPPGASDRVEEDENSREAGVREDEQLYTTALREYSEALAAHDGTGAQVLALENLRKGMSIETLYGDVLTAAMREVGRRWEDGMITVADEHVATEITSRVMAAAFNYTISRVAPRNEVIILAAIAGQYHSLGIRMVSDILELAGFQVSNLGSGVPTDALVDLVNSRNPDLLGLSCAVNSNPLEIEEVTAHIVHEFPDLPVIIGGLGVRDGMFTESASFAVCRDLSDVVETAERLVGA